MSLFLIWLRKQTNEQKKKKKEKQKTERVSWVEQSISPKTHQFSSGVKLTRDCHIG
jgi:hypothetical protein